jgi:DNA-binding protein HU-beta
VNKAQLVEALSARLGEEKKRTAATVDALLDTVYRTVQKGEKVALTGFGVFEKRDRAARTARNPATGEKVKVKKTSVPAFRAGQEFKNVVNGSKKLPKVAPAAAAKSTGSRAAADGATSRTTAKAAATRTAAKTTASKTTAKSAAKAPAKKAAAKSTTARKAPAKKTTAAKTLATKSPSAPAAKKSSAAKTLASKAPAKKSAAKKTAAKSTRSGS